MAKLCSLLGSLILLLSACSPPSAPAPAATSTETQRGSAELRLGIDQWPGYYPAVLADELGYFAEAGIRVDIQQPGDTDRMLAEFAAGQYDLIGVALGDLITLSRELPDVAVLLVSDQSAGGDALLAAPDYAPTDQGVVRIGTNLGGFGELFIRELLPRLGIDQGQVEWVNVDASDVPQALLSKQIDLGHCWEPYASQAVALGAKHLYTSADTPGLIPDVIATSRHSAAAKKQQHRAFVRAWFRAVQWWKANPDEAAQKIERRLAIAAGGASLDGIDLQTLEDNRALLIGSGSPTIEPVIERYSDFFITRGRLLEPIQAKEMLIPDMLP